MIIPNDVGTYSYELLIATYLKEINFKKLSAFKTNVFKKSYQKIKITDIVVRSVKKYTSLLKGATLTPFMELNVFILHKIIKKILTCKYECDFNKSLNSTHKAHLISANTSILT